MPRVLAYHITWGTYGTRLHGDPRGTVDRAHNEYGEPVLGYDPVRVEQEYENLKFAPVRLTTEQCMFAEDIIPEICVRGKWKLHTCAAAPDHVHVVLSSTFHPEVIRKLLKRWLGQELSKNWPLPDGQSWWAEDGSTKWIFDDKYFRNAIGYVSRQRIARPTS